MIADAVNPLLGKWEQTDSERTWRTLNEAVRCDSTDGNAWLGIWGEALHRLDLPMMRRAEQKLRETRFLTDAVCAYSRWTLRALPENAILINNGDMDTYPLYVVQNVENVRPDVAIVNRGLLSTVSYERYLRDYEGVPMPFEDRALESLAPVRDEHGNVLMPSDQIVQKWIEQSRKGQLRRPIAFASTVEESFFQGYKDNLVPSGAVTSDATTCRKVVPFTLDLRWDGGRSLSSFSIPVGASATTVVLDDDFESDRGWTSGGNATNGLWVREDPYAVTFNGLPVQPEDDTTATPGVLAWVTGNPRPKGNFNPSTGDVDGGTAWLQSPLFDGDGASRLQLDLNRWFTRKNAASQDASTFKLRLSTDNGASWRDLESLTADAAAWNPVSAGGASGWVQPLVERGSFIHESPGFHYP